MKQGTGHNSASGQKREPIPHKVNPAAVSEIGVHQSRTTSLPMYEGRGLQAPMNECNTHHCGSQGKHR